MSKRTKETTSKKGKKKKKERTISKRVNLEAFKQYAKGIKIVASALKALVESYSGKKDVKSRVAVLANPDNPKSMSILSRNQAESVAIAYFVSGNATWGEMFNPLKEHSNELMAVSPSIAGEGREQSIRFVGALSETKLLSKLGMTMEKETKEKTK